MNIEVYVKSKNGNYEHGVLYEVQDGVGICFLDGSQGGSYGWSRVKLSRIVPAEYLERDVKASQKARENQEAEKRIKHLYMCSDAYLTEQRNVAIGRELQIVRAEKADGSAFKEVVERLENMKVEDC